MYEQYRNELMSKLSAILDKHTLQTVINTVDSVSASYRFFANTEIIPYCEAGLPDFAKTYLACCVVEGKSEATVNNYRNVLTLFFNSVQNPISEITPNDIRLWMYNYKAERGISDRSLDCYRIVISTFFKWAVDNEYISKDPTKTIKKIKYESKQRQALTRLELENLRRACKTKRDMAIIDTMFSTGCRVSELASIKLSDINISDKSIRVIGKGNKERTLFLNASAVVSIEDYIKNERAGDCEYLFVSSKAPYGKLKVEAVRKRVEQLANGLCIDKVVTPHIVRHTTATIALKNGAAIEQVQRILGHSNVSTTLIYAEVNQSDVKATHERTVN